MAEFTPEEWAHHLDEVAAGLSLRVQKVLARGALIGEAQAKLNATTKPRVRGDRLRASIQGVSKGFTIRLRAGEREVPYARIQEFGGTIRPRRSRYLAVPLPNAKTPGGDKRFASPRDVPNLFVITGKSGNPVMMQRVGKQARPMFVLLKQVTIPATFYLTRAMKVVQKDVKKRLPAEVKTAILGGSRG